MKGRKKLRASVSLLILRRKALAFALAFALVLSTIITMVPMLEVKAEEDYSSYVNTTTPVEFNGNVWYIIEYDSTAETVTLLSKECVGASKFSDTESNEYSGSLVETAVKTYYDEKFLPETKTAIINDELFLLTSAQASALETANINVLKCSKAENALSDLWWLCSSGSLGNKYAAGVFGDYGYVNKYGEYVASACGVRPALKLDLSKVTFESDTFRVGASQSNEEETWEYPTSAPENPFDGGDGSANNPYEIATAQQLANLAWLTSSNNNANTYRTANYVLKNDINLGNKEWTISIGERKFFNGVFDGAGHTVSGLYINRPENYDSVGLFYEINDDNAVIKGLTVTGSVIGYIRVGGIVGCCRKGTIENCVNVCNVTGIYGDVGGICGYNRATVTGCDNLGNIIAPRNVGGICGELYVGSAVINNCSNSGSIEGNDANSNGGDVGGICGYLSEGTISRCYNTGIIRTNSGYVGGIAGDQRNSTTIECCYNSGSVMNIPSTRGSYVGGITGSQYNGIIQNCYNTGDITYVGSNGPGYVAGISACTSDFWSSSSSSIICNCYNFGNISISDNSTDNPIANNMGGIDGYDSSDSNNITHNYCLEETCDYIWGAKCTESVSGKYEFLTSTQFTDTNNFTGWDFETDGIWKMSTILGRPVLNGVGEGGDVYTVTFDSNDGSDVSSQMVVKNKVATEPTAPTKGGYVFGGWCSDSALTTAYDFSTAVSADITLYAKWLVCVPDVSATGYDDEFDGDEHSITVTAPEGATITYGETEGNYTSDNPSYKNVGEKTVYYKVTKDGYEPFTGSATVKITQKTIGIEWTNTAFTYNGNSQKPTATATGLVTGATCTITVTGEETNANVGEATYTATASSIDNANYKLPTANTTTFTISPASVTVSGITASNKSYDGNTTAILNYDSAVFAGVIGSDVLTVAATGTFADSKPGQNKTVNITGLTLGGTSAANYVLAANGQQESTTADITIETGTVIETIGNADESTTVIKTEYEDGELTGSTETTTSADEKTVTVVTKDADGDIVSTVETVTNTDGSTTVTEKNSSDKVTKETVTNTDGSKIETENSYDSAGNKTGSVVTTTSVDGKTVTVVEKDASGETIKTIETVNNADGTKTITETNADESSKVTEEDSAGNITRETVTNTDGSKIETENSYDSAGNKTGS
ncbi:MAG: InlB B-repeat-containing protein, partial [Lachnospiraceae bacterium]|nr:InlB B-repeat-containing protein [Lachnospiraceae bacterium]